MGIVDSKTGKISELYMGPGSRPRRAATAPDGTLWITLYGNGKLAHVDPAAVKGIREYQMPARTNHEARGGDGHGPRRRLPREIQTDNFPTPRPKPSALQF